MTVPRSRPFRHRAAYRRTVLLCGLLAGIWGNLSASLVQAEVQVVVGAGIAGDARTGDQFEYAVAAVVGPGGAGKEIAAGLFRAEFHSSVDGVETVEFGEITEAKIITDRETGRDRAELLGAANVKFRRGASYSLVPAKVNLSEHNLVISMSLGRGGVSESAADVFSGGNHFGQFLPQYLVIALGGGSTIESVYQAASAIGENGEAVGRLSLLANRGNGDLVRVDGMVDGAGFEPIAGGLPTGKRQHRPLTVIMSGVAAVDVFRPDGSSPETCFGDFAFVAHEGPHGPFRIDLPDCKDRAAGIEGTDIGSAAGVMSQATSPPYQWYVEYPPQ